MPMNMPEQCDFTIKIMSQLIEPHLPEGVGAILITFPITPPAVMATTASVGVSPEHLFEVLTQIVKAYDSNPQRRRELAEEN